jgi:hypothetical protein
MRFMASPFLHLCQSPSLVPASPAAIGLPAPARLGLARQGDGLSEVRINDSRVRLNLGRPAFGDLLAEVQDGDAIADPHD